MSKGFKDVVNVDAASEIFREYANKKLNEDPYSLKYTPPSPFTVDEEFIKGPDDNPPFIRKRRRN